MLVRMVEAYSYDLIVSIAKHYSIDHTYMLERYHTPYYYMPIVEKKHTLKKTT